MDTTKELTHIGLCAGYGGIELGLKRVLPTLRTIALCEIEAFAIANLVAKMETGLMDPAPIWTNLKTFPWDSFRDRVDILTGGYPCQPFSAAGKRAGADDPRHLWPFISAGIAVLRPSICFFENVEGHISLGLPDVIEDLGRLGYRATWGIFSAAEVGAPHQRKRVFILAYRKDKRLPQFANIGTIREKVCSTEISSELALTCGIRSQTGLSRSLTGNEGITGIADNRGAQDMWPSRPGQPQHGWEPPRVVANARYWKCVGGPLVEGAVCAGESESREAGESMGNSSLLNGSGQTGGQREAQARRANTARYDGQAQPTLGGDTNGPTSGLDYAQLCVTCDNRTDELRLLGNGVVPATAALAFRTLLKELTQ